MDFIRLISDKASHAFYNMSLDEAISEAVRKRLSPPTLRLYEWERPSLSIGYFQKISDIDLDYCNDRDYPVVRRLTGGRAILHDAELTYSFFSPANSLMFNNNLLDNYRVISRALILGLESTGIKAEMSLQRKRNPDAKHPACFRSVSFGEITVKGRKIIGSAQKRFHDGFLQHGSILLSFDPEELNRVLVHIAGDGCKDIGAIKDIAPEVSSDTLRNAFKGAFEKALNVKLICDSPSAYESELAKDLEVNKYSTLAWNHMR